MSYNRNKRRELHEAIRYTRIKRVGQGAHSHLVQHVPTQHVHVEGWNGHPRDGVRLVGEVDCSAFDDALIHRRKIGVAHAGAAKAEIGDLDVRML